MMMKGDRKKMSMVGEAHLHNDRAGTREGEGEPRTLMRGPRTLTPP